VKTKYVITLFVCGFLVISLWRHFSREEHGVGVDSVRWLPPKASNITYLWNSTNEIAEFDIERVAFENWCSDRGRPLMQLSNPAGDHTVGRCLIWLKQRGVDVSSLEPNETTDDDYDWEQAITMGPIF